MSVTVSTTRYEFSHNKKPRGYGHWAFFFDGETEADKAFFYTGRFAEAKDMAVRYAVSKGHKSVEVGS